MEHITNTVSAFTEDQTERLTGVSKSQLRYWDRTGFFAPTLAYPDRRVAFSRLYSFRDLACLKVISALRNKGSVSLPELRKVKEKLAHLGVDLWAKTTLHALNKKVIFTHPGTGVPEEVLSGQAVLSIPLWSVSGDIERAILRLRERDVGLVGKIERQRNIAHNEPVIAGTRVPVRSIQSFSRAGYSVDDIQKQYPTLAKEDVEAAIAYRQVA